MVRVRGIASLVEADSVLARGFALDVRMVAILLLSKVRLRLSILAMLSDGSVGEVGVEIPDSGLANSSE